MGEVWQNLVIAGVVIAAVAYLAVTYYRRRQRAGCPDCPVNKVTKMRQDGFKTISRR